jgi:acyl carrier protein
MTDESFLADCCDLLQSLIEGVVSPDSTLDSLEVDSLTIVEWIYLIEETHSVTASDQALGDIRDSTIVTELATALFPTTVTS